MGAGSNDAAGRRIAVLDDDPTGSQCVHGVSVVTALEASEFRAGLSNAGDTCFVLTNTRSLAESEAVSLTRRAVKTLLSIGFDGPLDIVSRSDSTLRGHVIAEISAITDEYLASTGVAVDGVLFCPAMIEAGRITIDDVHYARINGISTPVGETEFALDATFGYRSSNLRDFLAEKSRGDIQAVTSLSLEDIRVGGPGRIADILSGITGCGWVIVNATSYSDLEIVVRGLRIAQEGGKTFVYRSGPSFVRPLAGLAAVEPLRAEDIAIDPARTSHGIVAVGSHVGSTTLQVRAVQARGTMTEIELHVPTVLGLDRNTHVAEVVARVRGALEDSDVLLYTSRDRLTGGSPEGSLQLSMKVSSALTEVITRTRDALPAWVIAKGGITSHELAVHGLGIRRAIVVGQFMPGQISLFEPREAPAAVLGCPYVVFPGNVGDEKALAHVISVLQEAVAQARPDRFQQ